jgi:hypothetical protein
MKAIKVVLDEYPLVCKDKNGDDIRYNIKWHEQGDILMVNARFPIKKGQEFFINYGDHYWRHAIYYMIKPKKSTPAWETELSN